MMIGGVDVLLVAPADAVIGDVFLRACRRLWWNDPCVFQDANEIGVHPFTDPWVWKCGVTSKEFFVYPNAAAAQAWEDEGATRRNANTMLHFLVGDRIKENPDCVEIAVVCDKLTPEIRRLIRELEEDFVDMAPPSYAEAA